MPGRHFEAQALQDRAIGLVPEHTLSKVSVGRLDDQRGCAGRIGFTSTGVSIRSNICRHVDQALADRAIDHAEHVERAEQLHQIGLDENQIANRMFALATSPRRYRPLRRPSAGW
jgi:hypothetical protein